MVRKISFLCMDGKYFWFKGTMQVTTLQTPENPMMSRATCVIPADASKSFKVCSYIRYPISNPWLCPYKLNLWNSQLLFLPKKQVFFTYSSAGT